MRPAPRSARSDVVECPGGGDGEEFSVLVETSARLYAWLMPWRTGLGQSPRNVAEMARLRGSQPGGHAETVLKAGLFTDHAATLPTTDVIIGLVTGMLLDSAYGAFACYVLILSDEQSGRRPHPNFTFARRRNWDASTRKPVQRQRTAGAVFRSPTAS